MKNQDLTIQFYMRNDKSSLAHVGKTLFEQIQQYEFTMKYWGIDSRIFGQQIIPADIGICCGLIRDLKFLALHRIKIGVLVCENDLSEQEISLIQEANLTEIWVPSQFCIEKFTKAGFNNVALVPHGIDQLSEAPLKDPTMNILMIYGSYPREDSVKRKGIYEVLEAFNDFQCRSDELGLVKLTLKTQRKPYYSKHIDTYASNITFIEEYVPDLTDIYNDCDAVLCPSHSEGFGLVGLEALARGIPLISSKTGNDYLTSTVSYIHLNTVDKQSITSAIKDLYENLGYYKQRALEQRQAILDNNSWIIVRDNAVNRIFTLATERLGFIRTSL